MPPKPDVVNAILEAETEIQNTLRMEDARLSEWLESIERECSDKLKYEESKLAAGFESARLTAQAEAGKRADELLRSNAELCEKLKSLSVDDLKKIIMKRLSMMMPEKTTS